MGGDCRHIRLERDYNAQLFLGHIYVCVCMYICDITQFALYFRTQYFTLMMQDSAEPVNKTAT